MNSSQFSDQLAVMSEHYPVGVTTQFVSEEGAAENAKPRRRRRKSKGGEGGGGLSKRKLSEEQFSMLERSFGSEHKLESERKDRLAAELGLDPRQVAVWFQNRRARWKAKKMEEEYAKLRSQLDSTVVEKCRLETEVVKMKEQLDEAEREIQRLSERWKGFTSNSPASSSLSSMEANVEPHFLGEFGMGDVFYVMESNDAHGFEWDDRIYYM